MSEERLSSGWTRRELLAGKRDPNSVRYWCRKHGKQYHVILEPDSEALYCLQCWPVFFQQVHEMTVPSWTQSLKRIEQGEKRDRERRGLA